MGTIARSTKTATGTVNFGANTSAKSSEVNTDLNTIITVINGNLDNDNIKASAGILGSKLDLSAISGTIVLTGSLTTDTLTTDNLQLTTSTLVTAIFDEDTMASNSATALATQQSIKAYVDTKTGYVASGNFTRDISTTGTQAISGLGFQPKAVILFAAIEGTASSSKGFSNGTTHGAMHTNLSGTADNYDILQLYAIWIDRGSSNIAQATVAMGSDGFTLTWTKTNSPTGTAEIIYLAI